MNKKILIGTTSKSKIAQYKEVLKIQEQRPSRAVAGIKFVTPGELRGNIPDVAENARTFQENAVMKAVAFGRRYKMMTICDDSGLVVNALQGLPGIHSHRHGHSPKWVVEQLADVHDPQQRRACLITACAMYDPKTDCYALSTDHMSGQIADIDPGKAERRGVYGYDAILSIDRSGVADCLNASVFGKLLAEDSSTVAGWLKCKQRDGRRVNRLDIGYPRSRGIMYMLYGLMYDTIQWIHA